MSKSKKKMAGSAGRNSDEASAPAESQMEPESEKSSGSKAGGPSITIRPWDPKTPYVAALKKAGKKDWMRTYMAQRLEFGESPAFFVDCAEFFFRNKARAEGIRVISNLAELDLDNPALLRVMAHRLGQLDEFDIAIGVFEQVLDMRPDEPQSHRDLALVLARRGDENKRTRRADYRRALELLAAVVMGTWQRFEAIEVIALTELNNILPRARAAGVKGDPVDKRLIKALEMDVRIAMSWDADQTDMDLHVVEPSNEEAYYGHNRTTIGGMVSRDFTNGYGPEVYAVRKAMSGKYEIRTKYYGSNAAKLAGAVTLQVTVFTNYGRKNQQRKTLTLRLTENKEMFTVGTITF